MQTVIVDIDGTLADLTHRLHHVKGGNRNWDAFFGAVEDDSPIWPVCNLVSLLAATHKIILVSGRAESTRDATCRWLASHTIPYSDLCMRPDGDYRADYIVKAEILDCLVADGHDIAFVIDDRPSVVAMWRERGLTCFQCRDWDEQEGATKGSLTLLVGPTGAGKTTWLKEQAGAFGIDPSHVISSDQFRTDLCGDPHDQSRNEQVFKAMHEVARSRLKHGLPTVIDATNIKRKDRLACAGLTNGSVRYIVLNRPVAEKMRDAGWRAEVSGLIERHEQTFASQLKDILAGDGLPNVSVVDLRRAA